MPGKIEEALRFHAAALELRGLRQQILAANIANADTPRYQARDIDFAAALHDALAGKAPAAAVAASSPRHLGGASGAAAAPVLYRNSAQPSADGNTVDADVERAHFADNAVHYEANLTFINLQLKMLLAAIQG